MAGAQPASTRSTVPLGIAIALMAAYALLAHFVRHPSFVDLVTLKDGEVSASQSQAVDMVKELNTYLVSTVTLILGGLGWYLSQYRPPKLRSSTPRSLAAVAFVALAYVYGVTNVELTDELAQN